jgi:hypothetical protein
MSDIINRVSVELEGGWSCQCELTAPEFNPTELRQFDPSLTDEQLSQISFGRERNLQAHRSSRSSIQPPNCTCIPQGIRGDGSVLVGGESTGELSPDGGLPVDEILPWVDQNYPHHVNLTCGMHVHVSFVSPSIYASMATPEFEPFLVEQLVKWGKAYKVPYNHPFWYRLLGRNTYCKRGLTSKIITEQMQYVEHRDPRYYLINFAWARFQTIEFRILPMFKQKQTAIRAIRAILRTVDRFAKKRESYRSGRKVTTVVMQPNAQQQDQITVLPATGPRRTSDQLWIRNARLNNLQGAGIHGYIAGHRISTLTEYGVDPRPTEAEG